MSLLEAMKSQVKPVADAVAALRTTSPEKLREIIGKLAAEQQAADAEIESARAAYADALIDDEGGFGSQRAAALLRQAGDARERADALSRALAEARRRLAAAEEAEQRAAYRVRWQEATKISDERLAAARAVAETTAKLAAEYARLIEANERLFAAIPNATKIDNDAGHMRREQIGGAVRIELARLGCDWAARVESPHIIEPMASKFERAGKWIRGLANT